MRRACSIARTTCSRSEQVHLHWCDTGGVFCGPAFPFSLSGASLDWNFGRWLRVELHVQWMRRPVMRCKGPPEQVCLCKFFAEPK